MISTVGIKFSDEQKSKVKELLNIYNLQLKKKFIWLIPILCLLVFLLILYSIFLIDEKGSVSIVLKFATVLPLWVTVSWIILFRKRKTNAEEMVRTYSIAINTNEYEAIRFIATDCFDFQNGKTEFLAFKSENNNYLIIRKNDFDFDTSHFPNDHIIIPTIEFRAIVGNKIITKGNRIVSKQLGNRLLRHEFVTKMHQMESGSIVFI